MATHLTAIRSIRALDRIAVDRENETAHDRHYLFRQLFIGAIVLGKPPIILCGCDGLMAKVTILTIFANFSDSRFRKNG